MFFVAKLWDAFNDLFMGMIVDNTRSRWGKFVPWLVIGTLINAFVFITVFTDFHLSGVSLCVFASVEALRLCDGCIYFMGNDLYDYGYSVLVYYS